MAEFLPLCDLLFNIVSLAAYFCDFVFDILVIYALYEHESKLLFIQCVATITLTTILSQLLSLHWYMAKKPQKNWRHTTIFTLHVLQMGVLWRYGRLLIPVQLANVKREVRDLCILRLVHGFMQAAPMLLLQLTLLARSSAVVAPPADLLTVSAALSLFSVCWSLASFSKHVQSVDRLVLTWLGVVSQLLWRGGTVTARALALAAYAATYTTYIYLVLTMHWMCMFLWLLSPRSPFHGQRSTKKLGMCALIAAIYILAYINLQEKPHSRTMTIFYIVMLLENLLLIGAWLVAQWHTRPAHWEVLPIVMILLFFAGICFMLIYYKYFHVKRLMEKQQPTIQGVFNCRFTNPTTNFYRKKKKPSTFIPPPPPTGGVGQQQMATVPFWRRPLPSSSETDGSIGSRVNIHQKLQEKKQKQLAELKIIEEEIKQGKLVGPEGADFDDRQPIPRTKRHEPAALMLSLASLNNLASYGVNLNRRPPPPRRAPTTRTRTPELLLSPRYLYCDCIVTTNNGDVGGDGGGGGDGEGQNNTNSSGNNVIGSDMESQVSLPRSYTLPREFKYYRRRRGVVKRTNNIHIMVNNYSDGDDGDVDSVDDDDDDDVDDDDCGGGVGDDDVDDETDSCSNVKPALVRQLRRPFVRHETQL